jgi:anti-sigma factor RsiW
VNDLNLHTFWKLLLVSSILIGIFGLLTLGNLDTNISGDGIPNRPQSARAWDQAVQIIAVVALSAIAAIYSGIKIFR